MYVLSLALMLSPHLAQAEGDACVAPNDPAVLAGCMATALQQMNTDMETALDAVREQSAAKGEQSDLAAVQKVWWQSVTATCEAERSDVLDHPSAPILYYDCLQHHTWKRTQVLTAQLE